MNKEMKTTVRRNGNVELDGEVIGTVHSLPNPTGKIGTVRGYRASVKQGIWFPELPGIRETRREAVADIINAWSTREA